MATLSPVPSTTNPTNSAAQAHPVTWPQVVMTLGVLFFTGWMLTRGYDWYLTLLIAGGAVTVATGLVHVPRGIVRIVRAIGRDTA
ncbi:hypothetical protein OG948_33395 [Embleya sp. NBC_00888]|uniref:hypothetical protein n=1 Tax=Embleya sp. NBC_00888 TaxID=2975960 RepID=UPI0038692595|nr:hypothetical protein OG948_33395 [Embleya sp. NBC_00888]